MVLFGPHGSIRYSTDESVPVDRTQTCNLHTNQSVLLDGCRSKDYAELYSVSPSKTGIIIVMIFNKCNGIICDIIRDIAGFVNQFSIFDHRCIVICTTSLLMDIPM